MVAGCPRICFRQKKITAIFSSKMAQDFWNNTLNSKHASFLRYFWDARSKQLLRGEGANHNIFVTGMYLYMHSFLCFQVHTYLHVSEMYHYLLFFYISLDALAFSFSLYSYKYTNIVYILHIYISCRWSSPNPRQLKTKLIHQCI